MTRCAFIDKVSNYCGKQEAANLAKDYTDEEIEEHGDEIIGDLAEEYRFCANVSRYRDCGY